MIYKVEESLSNFDFWGQAKDNAREFSEAQLGQLEDILTDLGWDDYPTDTEINDLFAYDSDYLKSLLGWKQKQSGEYVNPDDLPDYDDEADAENIDLILDLAGVDRATRSDLAERALDANLAQWDADGTQITIEDFIDILEAVDDDGDAEAVQDKVSFHIYPQTMTILLNAYPLLCETEIDFDAVKDILYGD